MTMNAKYHRDCFTFSLSKGDVRAVRVELHDPTGWGIGPDGRASWTHGQYRLGKDLFMTAAEAANAAEAARLKKLASLKTQIAKLEKMSFAVVNPSPAGRTSKG